MSDEPRITNPFLPGAEKPPSEGPPLKLEWTAISVSGSRKPINDDSWLAIASDFEGAKRLEASGSFALRDHDLTFAVSDGMGGGQAGNVASKLLLEEFSRLIPQTFTTAAAGFYPDYITHLDEAIQVVHHAINQQAEQDPAKKGMAATVALGWFTPENLYFASAGDSRIYRYREGETEQITCDHNFAWRKMQRGEITERQYRANPRRSALYQIMGGGHERVVPDIEATSYQEGDRFLICSDGLVDGLWDKHIAKHLSQNLSSTSATADALIQRALANDGTDDTTIIVINVLKN